MSVPTAPTSLSSPLVSGEVWFLTGSQGLYGDDVLAQVADQSGRIAAMLAGDDGPAGTGLGVRLVAKPVLTDGEAIRRVLIEASADDTCLGVVAWMHTFSPARMWIAGLQALTKPLLHLHTQLEVELPWASIDMDFMNLNQAAHGDREFGHVLSRLRLPHVTVAGHASEATVRGRIAAWARVAAGLAQARSLRLARFGDTMRNVAVTEGDKVEAQIQLGVDVEGYGVNTLVEAVDTVSDAEARELAATYEDAYDVSGELRRGGERHDSLLYAARQEIALRAVLAEAGATAFTSNFEDLGGLRQLPGLAVQRLMADGYGFAGEGDWKTSALLRILKVIGGGRPGGTSFMEDYTYHLVPGRQRILGAHMLEVCPSITTATPSVQIHPLGIGDRQDPVRMVFTADPGPAVITGWSDLGDRFRLVGNVVDVVEPEADLPKLPVARAVWAPRPDWSTSTECWLTAGGPHHTVLSTQLDADDIAAFADLAGIELALVDADTTPRRFRQELRWNAASFRLAQRL